MASGWNNQQPSKKANLENETDRISTLPDEVLIHILSFLSTKMAVTTSILSSRWEYLWASVPNLYFCPSDKPWGVDNSKTDPKYMNFIDSVLLSHNSSVNKFHLNFGSQFDVSRVTAWISAVVKRNVREIEINSTGSILDGPLPLPRCLNTCRTLVTLTIKLLFQLDVPASIHFPCLKVLDILVISPSTNLTQKLFCSSPVLEKLSIEVFKDSGDLIYNISSPVLKKLSMSITHDIVNFDSVAIVDAPVLESLEIKNYCFLRYLLKNCVSLIKAHIHVDVVFWRQQDLENRQYTDRLCTLLKSVSTVKDLFIDRYLVTTVSIASERKLAVFSNVTRLELDVDKDFNYESFSMWSGFPSVTQLRLKVNDDFASKSLSKLLAQMPNLVSLFLHKVSFNETSHQFNRAEQVVPSCFRSCLREIEVDGLDGTVSELKLIKYLLANAEVLEKMTLGGLVILSYLEAWKEEGFESNILKMPRRSKSCKLLIGWRERERELVKLLANEEELKNTREFQ